MIRLKRVYEEYSRDDGYRVLIDRLWPRGLKKEDAKVDLWLKELAPSDRLRKWFGHATNRWDGFQKRYAAELKGKDDLITDIRRLEKKRGTITLLYAAKDEERNNAMALLEYLKSSKRSP